MSLTSSIITVVTVALAVHHAAARPGEFEHMDNCDVTCMKGDASTVCSGENVSRQCDNAPVQPICVKVRGGETEPFPETRRGVDNKREHGGNGGYGHHNGGNSVPPITVNSICEFCSRYSNEAAEIISCCACMERQDRTTAFGLPSDF